MDDEDIREVELSTIAAIYPEELMLDGTNPYAFKIEVPVSLSNPLVVNFPSASAAAPLIAVPQVASQVQAADIDSQEVYNLPALQIFVSLPEGYPQEQPPRVEVATSPPWLSPSIIGKLEGDARRLWEDMGRDQVIFAYIEDVRQSADTVFGLVSQGRTLQVAPEHKIAILDYDMNAKQRAFQKETFDCGICLDPKKGSVCHRMSGCGHVFCVQCLQDFYNNAITEGDVASVRCLEPNCAEARDAAARDAPGSKRRKPKTFISPSELLQIPLDEDMVKRYVTLKHKTELESDKNTVYCPRSWCQGAARSKKHKKPEGLDFAADSDAGSGDELEQKEGVKKKTTKESANQDLLAICEDCGFAFCSRCGQSWHGEFKYCLPKERKDEISEEEKASLEYLKMHTSPCPTCAAPCQKTHGCNHMRCFRCQTHFCYLCSAWLNPDNPYQHFNIQPSGKVNGCFMRLWELEGGDDPGAGVDYAGAGAMRNANIEPAQQDQHIEIPQQNDEDSDDDDTEEADGEEREDLRAPENAGQAEGNRPRPAVAREGPLVLRIEGNAPRARGRDRGGLGAHPPRPFAAPPEGARPRLPWANGGGQRGRGNRGQRGNRQNNRNRAPGGNQQANGNVEVANLAPDAHLHGVHEAWVRQFVQLALNDQEHLFFGDED